MKTYNLMTENRANDKSGYYNFVVTINTIVVRAMGVKIEWRGNIIFLVFYLIRTTEKKPPLVMEVIDIIKTNTFIRSFIHFTTIISKGGKTPAPLCLRACHSIVLYCVYFLYRARSRKSFERFILFFALFKKKNNL